MLLHGNSGSIIQFGEQILPLSQYYKVIAVDTRGQGKSGEDNRAPTYDLFADDMNALLDPLHLDSVDILGWSDGGNTGLIMAMKYPAKVHKLVTLLLNEPQHRFLRIDYLTRTTVPFSCCWVPSAKTMRSS